MKTLDFKAYGEKEYLIRYSGIVLLSFLIPLTQMEQGLNTTYLQRVPIAFVYSFSFWHGCLILFALGRKWFPSIKETANRLLFTVPTTLLMVYLVSLILRSIFTVLNIYDVRELHGSFAAANFMEFGTTIFIGTIYEGVYFFNQWKKTFMEAEQLRSQHLQSQLDVLKTQLSPHFLFNTLNTLMDLIHQDAYRAEQFTDHLAHVYRYILQTKNQELVPLSDELDFVRSYVFLQEIRHENALDVKIDIQDDPESLQIPPLSLQMLLENVLKHNRITIKDKMQVLIHQEDHSIRVTNPLNLKTHRLDSTGIGLHNIQQRFALLGMGKPEIIHSDTHFEVRLPLLAQPVKKLPA